jgi:hypothetical protein
MDQLFCFLKHSSGEVNMTFGVRFDEQILYKELSFIDDYRKEFINQANFWVNVNSRMLNGEEIIAIRSMNYKLKYFAQDGDRKALIAQIDEHLLSLSEILELFHPYSPYSSQSA